MMKSVFGTLCLSLALGLATIACGDDDPQDDDVSVDAPGVDVNVKKLDGAAGSAAQE